MQLSKQRDPVQIGIRVQIEAVAMQKFWCWVDQAKGEVSCLGLVEEIRDESTGIITALLVTDFLLVKQQCSMDETTMDATGVAELISTSLEAAGIDTRKLRCWAHSHGGLSVFWSGQDDDCISGLANGEYLLSLVVNKRHDSMMRLDQYHPSHLYLTDILWDVHYPLVDGLAEACFAEFKAKVTETICILSNGRVLIREHVQDLRAAQDRGALTMDELQDELDWLGMERDDIEERL